jgi:hypothetical protein
LNKDEGVVHHQMLDTLQTVKKFVVYSAITILEVAMCSLEVIIDYFFFLWVPMKWRYPFTSWEEPILDEMILGEYKAIQYGFDDNKVKKVWIIWKMDG